MILFLALLVVLGCVLWVRMYVRARGTLGEMREAEPTPVTDGRGVSLSTVSRGTLTSEPAQSLCKIDWDRLGEGCIWGDGRWEVRGWNGEWRLRQLHRYTGEEIRDHGLFKLQREAKAFAERLKVEYADELVLEEQHPKNPRLPMTPERRRALDAIEAEEVELERAKIALREQLKG